MVATGAKWSLFELNGPLRKLLALGQRCTSRLNVLVTVVNLAPLILAQAMGVFSEMRMEVKAVIWLLAAVAHGAAPHVPLRS